MEYKEFDVLRRTVFTEKDSVCNAYVIDISCDANDGDYMNGTIVLDEDKFEEEELFMLVLSYISKYAGKFGTRNSYGHHVADNKLFPWLEQYLLDTDLLIFAGMCDAPCHSVSDVIITYYDKDGVSYNVLLPDVDELFETEEQFKSYMNALYERYCLESGD